MLTSADRFLQVLNGPLLARVVAALLMVEPTELLENLGMVRVSVKNAAVRRLSRLELHKMLDTEIGSGEVVVTYVLLLLVDMADLEPDVLLGQGTRRLIDDKFEALLTVSTGFPTVTRG